MTHPEAFARVLIDDALRDSGWDLLNDHQVDFEYNNTSGRADYSPDQITTPFLSSLIKIN